jgi:23S rRNA (guanosine2251-2'-O)-methyltransferase
MGELIEGRNAVVEALRAGLPLERVTLAEGLRPDPTIAEIKERASASGVPLETVSRSVLDRQSARGAHQGVAATARPFHYADLAEVLRASIGRARSLVIVLDHITDPGNLGAVIRSAEVAGADAVVIPADRAASIGPIAHKASAGATAYVPVVKVANIARALQDLKDGGYWAAGADERGEQDLWQAPLTGRLALAMGAEGAGLSRLTRERCDFLVRIPVAGRVSSLNVAQATTVLAFEWVRRAE